MIWRALKDALFPVGVGGAVAFTWWGFWKGKKLAVLGARGVGKSHLLNYLTTGSLPENPEQTLVLRKTKRSRIKLNDLELVVKKGFDVPGGKAAYSDWKDLVSKADHVFYLLRADKIWMNDGETMNRAREDLLHINGWINDRKGVTLVIVGTHCDLHPPYSILSGDTEGEYMDRFQSLPIIKELVSLGGGPHRTKVVLGEMTDKRGTEKLAYHILSRVQEK